MNLMELKIFGPGSYLNSTREKRYQMDLEQWKKKTLVGCCLNSIANNFQSFARDDVHNFTMLTDTLRQQLWNEVLMRMAEEDFGDESSFEIMDLYAKFLKMLLKTETARKVDLGDLKNTHDILRELLKGIPKWCPNLEELRCFTARSSIDLRSIWKEEDWKRLQNLKVLRLGEATLSQECVHNYLDNLWELDLAISGMDPSVLRLDLLENKRQLKKLRLDVTCEIANKFKIPALVHLLEKLSELTFFGFSMFADESGIYPGRCGMFLYLMRPVLDKRAKKLTIEKLVMNFRDLRCDWHPNLEVLDLKLNGPATDEDMQRHLDPTCNGLTKLKLCYISPSETFFQLVERSAKNVKHLHISFRSHAIENMPFDLYRVFFATPHLSDFEFYAQCTLMIPTQQQLAEINLEKFNKFEVSCCNDDTALKRYVKEFCLRTSITNLTLMTDNHFKWVLKALKTNSKCCSELQILHIYLRARPSEVLEALALLAIRSPHFKGVRFRDEDCDIASDTQQLLKSPEYDWLKLFLKKLKITQPIL